mmetsp:Transcript_24010/g.58691  ORF Transcript_24010/g.58691 Transcript_24010/m.58691 type:complete len:460 (-) Transcript_24010:1324-2703(-)
MLSYSYSWCSEWSRRCSESSPQRKKRSRQLIGLRYRNMVPTADLSHLPASFQAAADDCCRDFIAADRGSVRQHNDISFDSRAEFFADWCTNMGIREHNLRELDDEGFIFFLGVYVKAVKSGDNHWKRPNLAADTVRNYLTSAHRYLEFILDRRIDIMDSHHGGKRPRLHPFLGQQIADRRRWYKPSERYEPFTLDMFEALAKWLEKAPDAQMCFLGKVHCVFDWCRLGIFTGFRIGEYGQSTLKKGELFARIPFDDDVPEAYRGMPLAMMASDFLFYDKDFILVPHQDLPLRHSLGEVLWLEIRWRYDKSAHNFVKKRFRLTGHPIFCPVDAGVSIIRRTTLLGVPENYPIGVWSSDGSSYNFLHAKVVTEVMRGAVDMAYPDPKHYMRKHRNRIVPHSNRVTAAVCLQKGGASNDDIAFKLRWHLTSVPTYLRDCFQVIGGTLEKAIAGAMTLTFSSS